MRTFQEYEASDIREDNPVHSFLRGVLMVTFMSLIAKAQAGEDMDGALNETVADILNAAQRVNITISAAERIPDVFYKEN